MTRDEIINLMQQACDPDKKPAWHNEFWTITQQELERFAALVAASEAERISNQSRHIIKRAEARGAEAEREACAELCLETEPFYGQMFAEAIRARGNR